MAITLLRRFGPLLLSGAVGFGMATPSNGAEELRIGFVAPTTGIFAQVGKDMVDGFQMYLDDVKSDFGGTKVKFIVEDEQAKPDTAVTRAKKLILQDKVHMLVGGLLASSGYALAPVSTADKTVYVVPVSAADDLTQRDLSKFPYMVRTGWSSSQPSHPFGQWACEQGYKKIAAIGADYAFGYEVIGGFQRAFEACGGQIIQKILAAARCQGLRAVYTDHQGRGRRDLLAHGRPDVAAVPQAAGGLRQQEAGHRRRDEL